jgi:hypothetical protein
VSPERILAGLPARARRVRRRRVGTAGALVAAVAAVVAAVAVPTVVLRPSGGNGIGGSGAGAAAPPATPVLPSPEATGPGGDVPPEKLPPVVVTDPEIASTAPPELAAMPLRYRPTWLPSGIAERSRLGWPGTEDDPAGRPSAERTWTASPVGESGEAKGSRLSVSFRWAIGPEDPQQYDGMKVTVNGKTGYYHDAGEKSYLEWRIDGQRVASVSQHGLGLSRSDMVRVAGSTRPDTARLASPVQFDALPRDTEPTFLEITGNSSRSWRARVEVGTPAPGGGTSVLSVEFGASTSATDGGERLTVGGRPARLVTRELPGGSQLRYLVVELSSTRLLTVISEYLNRDQLVKVAEGTRTSEPDLSWLGDRP